MKIRDQGERQEFRQVAERAKRQHYVLILLAAAFACLIGWQLGEPTGHADPFDRVVLTVMAVWLAALAWGFWARRVPVRVLEVALLASVALFLLLRLSYPLFWGRAHTEIDQELLEFAFYFPAYYAMAFLTFNVKGGMKVSIACFAASFLIFLVYLVTHVIPTGDLEGVYGLSQSLISSAIAILLFTVFAWQVQTNAEVAVKMAGLAHTDSLTGVPNRRGLEVALSDECLRASRYHRPLSVIMCDLDNFKMVNDLYGHHTGDDVLRGFALLLRENIREPDYFGRWGGEEFLVMLPETRLLEAELLARRVQVKLAMARGGMTAGVTASFGVAQMVMGDTLESLVRRADEALYAAKEKGRNTVVAA